MGEFKYKIVSDNGRNSEPATEIAPRDEVIRDLTRVKEKYNYTSACTFYLNGDIEVSLHSTTYGKIGIIGFYKH